jgi:hypothetical protein
MFGMKGYAFLWLIVVAAMVSIFCGGCGSGSSNNLSQAQAQAVTVEVSDALAQALESAFSSDAGAAKGARRSLSSVVSDIRPNASSGCTTSGSEENCNWPVSYDGACPLGGTIAVAGDIEATLSGSGDGSVSSQLTITPANCDVSNLVINGDPDVVVGLNMSFADSAPVFPITLTEGGGISYGPKPSGSCKFDVTFTITSETSCTIAGTACGQSVSGSC